MPGRHFKGIDNAILWRPQHPVAGATQNISPGGIPSSIAFGRPTISGPLLAIGIPSAEAFGVPRLDAISVIAPTGIPSAEAFGVPVILNSQALHATGIPSAEHFGTPTIRGGLQYLRTTGIPSSEAFGVPTVTGGIPGTYLFLSGVDVTKYFTIDETNACNVSSQTLGRWQAQFDLYDDSGTINPQLGETVLILDFGFRIFSGCITQVVTDRYISTVQKIRYHITATDKSGICDHRVITGKTYAAGSDVFQVIQDIWTNFLDGEGLTIGGVPSDGTLGALDSDLNFNFPTVTQAFDQIAQITGTVWWVDAFYVINFSDLTNLPAAPFSLSEISKNWRGTNTGGGLTTTRTTTNYYNQLFAVSNLNIVPGAGSGGGSGAGGGNTETITFTVGQPNVITGINPISGLPQAAAAVVSVGIGSVISMTVNGNPQTVFDLTQYAGQTSTGPTDYLWSFFPGDPTLYWEEGPVPSGATIVIEYIPFTSTNSSIAQYGSALNPLNPHGDPLGTCGSGVFQGVIQVQNISNQDDLNAIAAAELARIGDVPTTVDFQTDQPGLRPGQLLSVDVPLSGVQDSLLITQVSGTYMGSALKFGSSFRWDIQATSNLDPGNWIKWYERQIARTQNPLPVLQYEEAPFVLAPGSSLSGAVNVTNPKIVGRTGLAVEVLLAASTPPIDQTLVVTITRNNIPIVTVHMPAGTTANQLLVTTIPKGNQLYLYAHDVLNATVSYLVTGPSPVKAASVTCVLRWAM